MTARKPLGLAMPLATDSQRERMSSLVDDRPATLGIQIASRTMEPAYEIGDVALLRPCMTVKTGRDYVLRRKGSDPATYRLVRVERVTKTYIYARQFNPAMVRRMPRDLWKPAYKVTGRYNYAPDATGP